MRQAEIGFTFALLAAAMAGFPVLAEPPSAPDEPLTSPTQEARAQALFQDVRCVVCQHESIADSPAGIAGDMRRLVRQEIARGDTDTAIRSDLVRRWGDYILFKPPLRIATLLLWFGPVLAVLLALAVFLVRGRRSRSETLPLSPDEERRLDDLLHNRDLRPDPDATSSHD
ncbi:cytochrome c-type biogenesis protein CcmH [soil metagenome]